MRNNSFGFTFQQVLGIIESWYIAAHRAKCEGRIFSSIEPQTNCSDFLKTITNFHWTLPKGW